MTAVALGPLSGTVAHAQTPPSPPGGRWQVVPVPVPGDGISHLLDADQAGPSSAWAVGYAHWARGVPYPHRPIVVRWAGGRWVSTTFSDAGTGEEWEQPRGVAADGADQAWLVTDRAEGGFLVPAVRRWDPTSRVWTRVPYALRDDNGNYATINGITAADDAVWMLVSGVFDGDTTTRAATWDGAAWVYLPDLPVTGYFADIDASGRDNIWVTSYAGTFQWDGARWVDRAPGGVQLWSPQVRAANDIWARGSRDVNGSLVRLLVHWDGTGWSEYPIGDVGTLYGPVVDAAGDIWLVDGSGKPDRSGYLRFTGSAFEHGEGPVRRNGISITIRDVVTLPGLAEPLAIGSATVLGSPETATSELRRPSRG